MIVMMTDFLTCHEISDTNLQVFVWPVFDHANKCCREISAVVAKIGELGDTSVVCTQVLPPCASMCHYSGTSQIRNSKNHVLIREVPLINLRPVYKGGFYFCGIRDAWPVQARSQWGFSRAPNFCRKILRTCGLLVLAFV